MITEKKSYISIDLATQACVDHLVARLDSLSSPLLFFYSGGSCLPVLSTLIESLSLTTKTYAVTFAPIDERFEKEYNTFMAFKQEYSTSYAKALKLGCTFIDTSPQKKDQYDMAMWYESIVKSEIYKYRSLGGNIISLIGMGEDGHIAGIFPDNNEKEFYKQYVDSDKMVIGISANGKQRITKRFTLTVKALEYIDEFILYISGEKKNEVVRSIETMHLPLHMIPASYLYYTSHPCTIFRT